MIDFSAENHRPVFCRVGAADFETLPQRLDYGLFEIWCSGVEQIVDDEHRNEDEGEDDRKQTQHEAEALLAEDLFDARLGRLSDLGRRHFAF